MDVERARAYLLSLPHVVETRQWGDNLVFWAGDKAVGGKMFALIGLDGVKAVISFSAGAEAFAELVERQGLLPAPYMTRIFWVAAERWSSLRNAPWEELLAAARDITYAKLPQRVRTALAWPQKELAEMVVAGRKRIEAKAEAKRAAASKPATARVARVRL